MVMVTLSTEAGQTPFDIVQLNVTAVPGTNPVTDVIGEESVVMVAVPDTTAQLPVPITGVFPASV